MCTNASTYLVVKKSLYLKLLLSAVGFYRGVSGPKLLVVKDILVVLMSLQPALATEAIVWPLRCTQLVALSVTTRGLLHQNL